MAQNQMPSLVGVKSVQAESEYRNGQAGFAVIYQDGYRSWSPAEVFEKAYLYIPEGDLKNKKALEPYILKIMFGMIQVAISPAFEYTAHIETVFGEFRYSTSLQDDTDEELEAAAEQLLRQFVNELGGHLEFVRQWARNGIIRPIETVSLR